MDHLLNVLLVGGGGREHALAWKLSRSASIGEIWATDTGNPGIASIARPIGFEYSLSEMYRLQQLCAREEIDLVVVGPEVPLDAGMADALTTDQTFVFFLLQLCQL